MTQNEINENESSRGESRNYGLYRSSVDDRVCVPMQTDTVGTTITWGHRSSGWALLGVSLVPLIVLLGLIIYRLAR